MKLQILGEHSIDESTFGQVEAIVIVGYEGTLIGIAAAATNLEILVSSEITEKPLFINS
jgi:hypothetical protein